MDLNNLGTGKNLVDSIIREGNLRRMGWTKQQQEETLNKHPNTRKGNK